MFLFAPPPPPTQPTHPPTHHPNKFMYISLLSYILKSNTYTWCQQVCQHLKTKLSIYLIFQIHWLFSLRLNHPNSLNIDSVKVLFCMFST